ncbi:TetR/AcrR family transcriptional regulator [Actinomycetospora rhizophila]|uniref:TetR/AcrR family transcriptional regulator n=1 Tax=Actinomycetospora rhizophila TaxID=1416876 RepID=A0ABV9ZPK5_9PSEU
MSPRPYRLGERAVAVADTRRRIVGAARDLLCAGGPQASLDEVARRADVARATVYQHFGSKLGLVEGVLADLEERADLAGLTRVVTDTPPAQLVGAVIADGCRYWATDPVLARRILGLAAADPGAAALVARHDEGRLALLRTVVDRLAAAGLLGVGADEALDVLWLVTSFDAYDTLASARGRTTRAAAALLTDIAYPRLARRD